MRREDLTDALFEANLVSPGRTIYAFHVNFAKLSRHELCSVFIDDLIKTFKYEQAQHPKNLGLVFNTHISKNLVKIISERLGVEYGEFDRKTGNLCGCRDDSDYVFMGYCISEGRSIHDADLILCQLHKNSHIISGLYFFDRERWQKNLEGKDIDIYSTLNWRDLNKANTFAKK